MSLPHFPKAIENGFLVPIKTYILSIYNGLGRYGVRGTEIPFSYPIVHVTFTCLNDSTKSQNTKYMVRDSTEIKTWFFVWSYPYFS